MRCGGGDGSGGAFGNGGGGCGGGFGGGGGGGGGGFGSGFGGGFGGGFGSGDGGGDGGGFGGGGLDIRNAARSHSDAGEENQDQDFFREFDQDENQGGNTTEHYCGGAPANRCAAAAAGVAPMPPLPAGWFQTVHPEYQQVYYYNQTTQQASWERPRPCPPQQA